ncbi:MAG: hypothetical protein VCF25_22140 [Candidatus Poribacteria bacterium]
MFAYLLGACWLAMDVLAEKQWIVPRSVLTINLCIIGGNFAFSTCE